MKLNVEFSEELSKDTVRHYENLLNIYLKDIPEDVLKTCSIYFGSNTKVVFDLHAIISKKKNIEVISTNSNGDIFNPEIKIKLTEGEFETKLCAYQTDVNSQPAQKCLFLDRDGIIIKDIGYPHKISDLHLLKNILPIIQKANQLKIPVICCTNQSGIARGYFTIKDYQDFTNELIKKLDQNNCSIDLFQFSPFHKEGTIKEFTKDSVFRKPKPGMFLKCFEKLNIDFKNSLMIGDKKSDIIEDLSLESMIVAKDLKDVDIDSVLSHRIFTK